MERGNRDGSPSGGDDGRPLKKARFSWQVKGRASRREDEAGTSGSGENSRLQERNRYMLHVWQAKQMARGVLDNTMNRMLENMHRHHDQHLEDEAVLMAIQRHGLQRGPEENWGPSASGLQYPAQHRTLEEAPRPARVTPPLETTQQLSQHEHDSILDAAVVVAIQEKGLSVLPES